MVCARQALRNGRLSVRLRVSPVDRQQQRRVARLLLLRPSFRLSVPSVDSKLRSTSDSCRLQAPWASTPLEHWGSQVERRRCENRGAVGCEGGGVSGGAVPLPGKFMNFSSQNGAIWCILCVLFLRFMCPMDCSCIINYRSTSLCLTNDTDWQIHVTANFVYIYCQ